MRVTNHRIRSTCAPESRRSSRDGPSVVIAVTTDGVFRRVEHDRWLPRSDLRSFRVFRSSLVADS
eukprot:459032-Hanusia_phi.AAC.1